MSALSVVGLWKSFGRHEVLRGVYLEVADWGPSQPNLFVTLKALTVLRYAVTLPLAAGSQ